MARAATARQSTTPTGQPLMTLAQAEESAITGVPVSVLQQERESDIVYVDDVEEDDSTPENELSKLLIELDGDEDEAGKVKITRVRPNDSKESFCFECSASEFSLQRLAIEYGGGNYRVRIYSRNPDNANRYSCRLNKIYTIEERKAIAPGASIPQAVGLTREDLRDFMMEMRTNQPQERPMQTMQEMLTMMVSMQQLMPQPAAAIAGNSLKETLENMAMLRSLAGDLVPGGEPKSDVSAMLDTAKSFLPVVSQMVQSRQQPAPAQAALRPALPRPVAVTRPQAPAPAANPAPQKPVQTPEQKMYGEMLGVYSARAARGLDPEQYAEVLLDDVGPDNETIFVGFLEQENWFEILTEINPVVAPYKEWFSALRKAVFECFQDASDPQPVAPDGVKTVSAPIVLPDDADIKAAAGSA